MGPLLMVLIIEKTFAEFLIKNANVFASLNNSVCI